MFLKSPSGLGDIPLGIRGIIWFLIATDVLPFVGLKFYLTGSGKILLVIAESPNLKPCFSYGLICEKSSPAIVYGGITPMILLLSVAPSMSSTWTKLGRRGFFCVMDT